MQVVEREQERPARGEVRRQPIETVEHRQRRVRGRLRRHLGGIEGGGGKRGRAGAPPPPNRAGGASPGTSPRPPPPPPGRDRRAALQAQPRPRTALLVRR